jgi:hypothetical protein
VPLDVILDALLAAVALALVGYLALVLRRRYLARVGGTFDCSIRVKHGALAPLGKGWVLGLARYAEDRLDWYRVFSYSPRPRRVLRRRDLQVQGRRTPTGNEALALVSGAVVVECRARGGQVELAMTDEALTGFLAWLESAPPGRHYPR